MRALAPVLLICLLPLAGCGAEPRSESGRPAETRVVVLRAGPLHLERDIDSPGVTEVPAGVLLRVVADTADSAGDAWVRVATWDDRRGWIPATRLMEAGMWARYGRELGGVSPILLRPAYPVEGGRWAVEAPLGSPGFTPASSAWVLGDSAREARVVEIDSLENLCDGERYRFGALDRAATAEHWPFLEGGLLAAPSGARPTSRWMSIGPLDPDPALVELARSTAAELGPPGAGGPAPPESIEWAALGETAAWAALSWPFEDAQQGHAQLGAALVFRRASGGWELAGRVALTPSTAEIPSPAWRPVAAYATGAAFPTLLLLKTLEYEGAHLDIWIAREDVYERIYRGYYWGC